jgi:hypothetical protein
MDGGSLAASESQTVYAWRRDRTFFITSEDYPETVLADSGTHPVVFRTANGFAYIWQDQGRLYLKGNPTETGHHLADGAFFSAAWNSQQNEAFSSGKARTQSTLLPFAELGRGAIRRLRYGRDRQL